MKTKNIEHKVPVPRDTAAIYRALLNRKQHT